MKKPSNHPLAVSRRHSITGFIAAFGLALFAGDLSAVEVTYQYYRFAPTTLRGAGANSIQLAEFTFGRAGSPVSLASIAAANGVTTPVINPQPNPNPYPPPANESPGNLIDGNPNTKWLDFNKGTLVFNFGTPTPLNFYNFITANDATERDPISWTFEGSSDGVAWVVVDTITNNATPTARRVAAQGFEIGVGNLPTIVSYNVSHTIVKNGNAVDLDWEVIDSDSVKILPDIGDVNSYDYTTITPSPSKDTIYTLTATTGSGSRSASQRVRAVVGGSATYRYLRFTPIKLRNGNISDSVQLGEFYFSNDNNPVAPLAATSPGGNSPPNEGPANAIDGDTNTKWLDFNKGKLIFDFATPTEIDAYSYATANDSPERDAVQWTLEGSNDATTWNLVESVNFDYPITTARFARISYDDIPLPGPTLAPSAQIFADAAVVISGEPLLLTWTTTAGDAASIDQGVGTVPLSGSVSVVPTGNTTYTLTTTSGLDKVTTAAVSVTVINPPITAIQYPNFNNVGQELQLARQAHLLNDHANIPLPQDATRLRLNNIGSLAYGWAWFASRVDTSAGFDTRFGLQFTNNDPASTGADGITFMLQNDPHGTTYQPIGLEMPANALNIVFDSYQNLGDPSAASIRVTSGGTKLAEVDLTTIAGITLRGSNPGDLTDKQLSGAPYAVRITYVPGDLDLYFDGVLVIDSLNVNLVTLGAANSAGMAYTGFSGTSNTTEGPVGTTVAISENHDVTSWTFTEGPLVAPTGALKLISFTRNPQTHEISLIWSSSDTKTYRITRSPDLSNWSTVQQSGIQGTPGGSQTSATFTYIPTTREFYRIEEE